MSKEQAESEYQPSKSSRVASPIAALEDRWEEWLTVCEVVNPRTQQNQLEIRSFFESTTTKEKVWDEPPSGAVNIVWASDEAKEMAAAQLLDLQIVKGEDTIKTKDDQNDEKKKKKFSLKNIFKRRDIEVRTPDGKMAYKPGSNTALFVGTKDTVDEHNMQLQIAMSESLKLQDQEPNPSMNFNEEDDIDLATALSLSELDIHDQSSPTSLISQEQEDRKPAAK